LTVRWTRRIVGPREGIVLMVGRDAEHSSPRLKIAGALLAAEGAIIGGVQIQYFVTGSVAVEPALPFTIAVLAVASIPVIIGVGLAMRRRWAWIAAWFVVAVDVIPAWLPGAARSFWDSVGSAIGLTVGALMLLGRNELAKRRQRIG
jgi:hypothetical protein